jgi:cytochrome P450
MGVTMETQLPTLPVELPAFSADPSPFLEAARRQHPWLARFSQGYIVHGCQAVTDLLADEEHLRPGFGPVVDFYGLQGTMWGRFMQEIIMARSGDDHKRLRDSIRSFFTPRRASGARDMIKNLVCGLLDQWAPRREFDFADFASHIPVAVVFGLLGVSTDTVARIRSALENQLLSVTLDPAAKPLFLAGWDVLWDFADTLVKEHETRGELDVNSLLDSLIVARNVGQLDEIELRFMVLTMVIGGYDTTKNQLTMTMKLIVERPELYARCADDLQFSGKVVNEALRHSATVSPFRAVAGDFEYRNFSFSKGETLVLSTPLAGRDPMVFARPETFDPDRSNTNHHVGFGRGIHNCPGQFVARTLMQETLHLAAQRLKNPRITGEIEWRSILGSWGQKHLNIAFEPA